MLRNFVAFSSEMATEYRNKDFMLEDLAHYDQRIANLVR